MPDSSEEPTNRTQSGYPIELHVSEFEYNWRPVGIFLDDATPRQPGEYCYEPYRGPGHYEMAQAVREGRTPRCGYVRGTRCVTFDVVAIATSGLLVLDRFKEKKVEPRNPYAGITFSFAGLALGSAADELGELSKAARDRGIILEDVGDGGWPSLQISPHEPFSVALQEFVDDVYNGKLDGEFGNVNLGSPRWLPPKDRCG